MPDIKDMEGPVKFKKGVELYFDPKKDMFYDPKKKKYVSEKDILALEEVELTEKISCGCGSDCGHCEGKHSESEVGKECKCCGNEIMKEEKEKDMEEIEESRIRLSSLMNGGALLYDRDEDPDDDKLATVKVKGNPKKDIKNGDDLVLSLMGKGKSKEKEILKSLKKYYPKSKVVKEERIQEMFDLGDKVKRKDGSEEGEVVQRKTEDKSVGGRYKLKLKNGSRSKWINGNSLELVEQFSKKMEKYVDACGKDFTNWK